MIEINKTAKRLLSASRLGISFDYADGHRWLTFSEENIGDNESMLEKLEKHKIAIDVKIYGNIIDCLNLIDAVLRKINEPTLEERFDNFNDWGFDDEFVCGDINWEDSGGEVDYSQMFSYYE